VYSLLEIRSEIVPFLVACNTSTYKTSGVAGQS